MLFSQCIVEISYKMTKKEADHAIARYANGYNDDRKFYTVLSGDSCFYIYDLNQGYVSFKDLNIKDLNDSTEVPVYYSDNLLKSLDLNFRSWFYFCILLGEEDVDLKRNDKYIKDIGIKVENGFINKYELMKIIKLFQNKKDEMKGNNYSEIIDSFELNDDKLKINNLYKSFTFENELYCEKREEFIDCEKPDSFDRFITNIRDSKKCFLNCKIEDTDERSVFSICQDKQILNEIYFNLLDSSVDSIIEYSRIKKEIHSKNIMRKDFKDYKWSDKLLSLKEKNDDLSLLYWLKTNDYKNNIINKIEAKVFTDAVLYNLIILNRINEKDKLIELYKEIKQEKIDDSNYFDLKLVHRLNEFQRLYLNLDSLNRIKEINLKFLSPSKFLNCFFVCRFIKESSHKQLTS